MVKREPPRLRVIDTESGELFDLEVRPRRARRTISMMYGPNWTAVRCAAFAGLLGKDLTRTEYRVLFFLLSEMGPGNHIVLRPVDVARAMGMKPTNAAKALRGLRERGILLDRLPFGWRLHPEIGWRGDPTGLVAKRKDGSLVLVPG